MRGLTDYITTVPWEDVLTFWYVTIADAYQQLEGRCGPWRQRGPTPSFSDAEVITVSLFIDTYFAGHEALGLCFLARYHPDLFPQLLDPGPFNERRRALCQIIEQVRQQLTADWALIGADDGVRLLDSAPISLATYARGSDTDTVCGSEFWGVCPSKGAKIYGLKLHLTATTNQVVDQWVLAPAAYHDSQVITPVLEGATNLDVLADGAYNEPGTAHHLAQRRNIRLWAPPRKDSRHPWPKALRRLVGRWRRQIECVFNVLTVSFHIEQPGARSLEGVIARVATRLLAYNLSFITRAHFARTGA
jgi:hypothetical protein